MTELYELYKSKGRDELIKNVRSMSDGRLLSELDDTIQIDVMNIDAEEWASHDRKKVYTVIKNELLDRLDTDSRRVHSRAEMEAHSIIQERALNSGIDDLLSMYVRCGDLSRHAYDMDNDYNIALYGELRDILSKMITGYALEEHGYVLDTTGDHSRWRKEE